MKEVKYSMKNKKRFINLKKLNSIKKDNKDSVTLKKVLLSLIIICLSSSVLITATTALFTGEKEVGTHVVTGNLDFEFKRTNLIGQTLNGRGFLEDFQVDSEVNLKQDGANAFNIKEMVPGATYRGSFHLENTGTTAFEANISFVNLENSNEYLLKQIKITLNFNNVENTYNLIDFRKINLDLGVLACDEFVNFDIAINLPSETTNEAQDANVDFDLRLEATQVLYEN